MGHRYVQLNISAGTGNLHTSFLGDRIKDQPMLLHQDVAKEVRFWVQNHLSKDEIVARLGPTVVVDFKENYKRGVTPLTVVQHLAHNEFGEKVGTILVEVI